MRLCGTIIIGEELHAFKALETKPLSERDVTDGAEL